MSLTNAYAGLGKTDPVINQSLMWRLLPRAQYLLGAIWLSYIVLVPANFSTVGLLLGILVPAWGITILLSLLGLARKSLNWRQFALSLGVLPTVVVPTVFMSTAIETWRGAQGTAFALCAICLGAAALFLLMRAVGFTFTPTDAVQGDTPALAPNDGRVSTGTRPVIILVYGTLITLMMQCALLLWVLFDPSVGQASVQLFGKGWFEQTQAFVLYAAALLTLLALPYTIAGWIGRRLPMATSLKIVAGCAALWTMIAIQPFAIGLLMGLHAS